MLLGIVEDLTSDKALDAQLLAVSDSGLSINEGVHPSITIDNLLHFLPNKSITPAAYVAGITYSKFEDSRLLSDVVTEGDFIYQSLVASNTGNAPSVSPTKWLVTNIESLRLKVFLNSVKNKVLGDLNLVQRLTDSQYLYNLIEQNDNITAATPSGDYIGYSFEAKGSDYTSFTINEVALQATTAAPQNLYVINQGVLVTTLVLNPNLEGRLEFEDIDYTFSGKGQWYFVIDAQDVLTQGSYIDHLKYDGFVPRMITGTGAAPETALYSFGSGGNGLAFNITAHFDPSVYIAKNLKNFGKVLRASFELQALKMFRANSNNVKNGNQLIQMDETKLRDEVLVLSGDTSANKYDKARLEAIGFLAKTYDREIENNNDDSITVTLSAH